ncbi:MAG TPA: YhdP family protein [Gammaproteobacteria bacterium]|nr:YhdP family protein [Gammaproteobacteria bacterium]
MNVFSGPVIKKIAYILAIGIIIVGLLVSASPVLSPLLNQRRIDLEQWASQLLGVPVNIQNVQVSWYRYQPEITFNEVTFLNKDTKDPVLQVRNIGVLISVIQSLWQHRIVPSGVIASGSNLTIHRAATGEISVQGFPIFGGYNQQPFAKETKITELFTWLSTPARIILHDVNIRYSDFTNQKQFITLDNLSLENDGDRHTILGQAILHQDIPTEASLAIEWKGNPIDLTKIQAKIYLYVSGFLLPQWVKFYTWNGWQINDGILSAKIWATWDGGVFHRMQVHFQSYGLDLYSHTDKTLHKVNRLSGHMGWKREGENQIFAGEDILIDLPSRLWPSTNFYAVLAPNANKVLTLRSMTIGYLDLQDMQSFLFSSPIILPKSSYEILKQLQLDGGLQDASFVFSGPWRDWSQLTLTGRFRQLHFLPWRQLPGVRNLSGSVTWDGRQGKLLFNSNRLILQYNTVFKKPITIDQLTGELHWQQDESNHQWLIHVPSMHVLNNDGTANVSVTLTIPKVGSSTIDLIGHFAIQKADHIVRYLPTRMLDPEFEAWLKQAFLGGDIHSGNIELQGVLTEFPFDNNNGKLLISGKINNVNLNYAPGWPRLHHINGQVTFLGRRLSVDIDHATINNIPIKNIQAEIPYIGEDKPQILHLNINNIQTDFTQGLRFIHTSPLEDTIGKMFSKMEIKGPLNVKLGLIVPVRYPEKAQLKGELNIPDAQLKLPIWHLTFKHLRGHLSFTEDTATANNIQGQWFNRPIQMNVITLPKINGVTTIQTALISQLAISDLENWLKISLSPIAKGITTIIAKVNLSLKVPLEVKLNSNLVGVALQLPDPYKKDAQTSRDFSADIHISDNQPLRTKIIYSNLFGVALILERKNEKLKLLSANFHLGEGDPSWPTASGLYISGHFDQLDWSKIEQYANQTDHTHFADLTLRGIDINTKNLDIFGQHFTQVSLQVIPIDQTWKINISSPDVVGQVNIPMKFSRQGIVEAEFQRLSLSKSTTGANTKINVKLLPTISLVADDFRYDNMPFGKFILKATPEQQGLIIQTLQIMSPLLELRSVGTWSYSNNTHLRGEAVSRDVSALLNGLKLDAHNFVSSDGKLSFNLNWHGAPYSSSLASMSGNANLRLGKGRVVEVGETRDAKMGIGRMLSIFSLQTIPRRLMFDFSDLFQKGYSFDNVRGDFDLHQGNAYTTNLQFDGPLARVSINGRIGLQKKDYDLTLSVTPNVSSSLPAAAAGFLTAGPIGGAAALAVSTVLSPAVSKAATYYYEVKGPWDSPSWATIDIQNTKSN